MDNFAQEQLAAKSSRRWSSLIVLCLAQFMGILDGTIVNVALQAIREDLGLTLTELQWVVNMYVLLFGGTLLLGGRLGDRFGRRRLFIVGLMLFGVASLLGGLAQSFVMLAIARGLQGLGMAVVSPNALALISVTFSDPAERNRALGVWGALAGLGAAAGVLLGGVLTSTLGWPWVFLVNVPVAVIAIIGALRLVVATSPEESVGFDLPGALLVTAGMLILVYGVVQGGEGGGLTVETIGFVSLALLLFGIFFQVERRASAPLIPLSIFRERQLVIASLLGLAIPVAPSATFFFSSLYLQEVLSFPAWRTGLAFVPFAVMVMIGATTAGSMVTRYGLARVLVVGLTMMGAGLLLLLRADVDGIYLTDVLPAYIVTAFGLGLAGSSSVIMAMTAVDLGRAGLASGLINTANQLGLALGLAILATIAASRTMAVDDTETAALTAGFQAAWLAAAIIQGLALMLLISTTSLQIDKLQEKPT